MLFVLCSESCGSGLPWLLGDGSYPDVCSSLAPLVEHEGEAYLEKAGGMRRHTVANAHSDARLLTGRMRCSTAVGGPAAPAPDTLAAKLTSSTPSDSG